MRMPVTARRTSVSPKIASKTSSTELVKPSSSKELTIEEARNNISVYRSQLHDIQNAIDSGMNMESTSYLLSAELLKAVVKSIPNYEEKLLAGSSRDVYAFAALIESTLKLTNEMRALQDRSAMAKLIMDNIIRPQLEIMARKINADVNRSLMELDKKYDVVAINALNTVKENTVEFISNMFSETGSALQQYFGGQARQEPLDV